MDAAVQTGQDGDGDAGGYVYVPIELGYFDLLPEGSRSQLLCCPREEQELYALMLTIGRLEIERRSIEEAVTDTPIPVYDLRCLEHLDVPDPLICEICREPFFEPIRLNCQHHFCKDCFDRHKYTSAMVLSCPSCRAPLVDDVSDVRPADLPIRQLLDSLKVKCCNTDCEAILYRDQFQSHIKNSCPGTQILCPEKRCLSTIRRDKFELRCQHRDTHCPFCNLDIRSMTVDTHLQHCRFAEFDCDKCLKHIQHRTKFDHSKQDCEAVVVKCKGAQIGCPLEALRSTVQEHETTCPLVLMLPRIMRQNRDMDQLREQLEEERSIRLGLGDDFSALRTEHQSLRTEHQALNNERQSLRSELHSIRTEHHTLRAQLGLPMALPGPANNPYPPTNTGPRRSLPIRDMPEDYENTLARQGEILENHADIIDLLQHNVTTEIRDLRATIDVAIRSQIMNVENHLLELQSGMFAMRNEMRSIIPLLHRTRPQPQQHQQQPSSLVSSSHVDSESRIVRREDPKL